MFDYSPYIKSLAKYMLRNGYTKKPFPKVMLLTEEQDEEVFIKTANYDPDERIVNLFIANRHPKDVLRSFAHEMIHHKQNIEGRLGAGSYEGDRIVEDEKLMGLEKEAYLMGNISFRKWTETVHKS
jgi:hypothetical protein